MRTLIVALGLAGVLALATPRPAAADFALSIGLPGFGFYVADPIPSPVVYAPPVYARSYHPRPYYRPVYRSYHRGHGYHRGHSWGHHRGWRGHHDCDD